MSYLLEALRKSERERQEKTAVPGLQTPTIEWESGDDARTRSPWLLVAVLAICLNTVLLAVLVWRFAFAEPTNEPNNTGANSATNSAANSANMTVANPPAPVPAMPPVIVVQQPRETSPAIVVRERADAVLSSNRLQAQQAAGFNYPTASESPISNTTGTSESRISAPPVAERVTTSDVDRGDRTDAGSNTGAVSSSKEDSLLSVHALPMAMRQQLPALTMNSHIYANNPRDSFVMINGSSFSPGQLISTDLKLVAVVPDGALLEFQGQRFLLPALANFTP